MRRIVILLRQSLCATPILVALLIFLLIALAAGQQPAAAPETRKIAASDAEELQQNLDRAAAAGFRIAWARPGGGLGTGAEIAIRFIPFVAKPWFGASGASLTLERIPEGSSNYEYRVIKMGRSSGDWADKLNKAAIAGFRVIPGYTFVISEPALFAVARNPTAIMEKAPGDTSLAPTYSAIFEGTFDSFRKKLEQRCSLGFGLLWMGDRPAAGKIALFEKRSDAPVSARVLISNSDTELRRQLSAAGKEGFCIGTSTFLSGAWHGNTVIYLEPCGNPLEYAFVSNSDDSQPEFEKLAAGGYRLVPSGVFGSTLTLVKMPAGKRYEYRFVKESTQADELRKSGYNHVAVSKAVKFGKYVLEREASATTTEEASKNE